MTPNAQGGRSSKGYRNSDLRVDEEIELDDDIKIKDTFTSTHDQTQPLKPTSITKSTIAGVFLLFAFMLNLLVPITSVLIIYDSETATGNTQLNGEILDSEENPVANVTVSLLDTNLTTKTDENGKYSFKNAPVGENTIQFVKEGYHQVRVRKTLFSKSLLDRMGESGNIIDIPGYLENLNYIEPFDGPYNITLIIEDNFNHTLFGNVSNSSYMPVVNGQVSILNSNITTQTDNDGMYRLNNIPPGFITIQVTHPMIGYYTNVTLLFANNQSTELNISYNESKDQHINTVKDKTGAVHGKVLDNEGKSIENVRIILEIDELTYPNNIVLTDAAGEYFFSNIPLGIYNMFVLANDFKITNILNLTILAGENYSVPELELIELSPVDIYEEDISGAYVCIITMIILAVITLFGAISAFQRKRYSIAFIGAVVGMFSIFLPPRLDICLASLFCMLGLVFLVFSRSEFDFKKLRE